MFSLQFSSRHLENKKNNELNNNENTCEKVQEAAEIRLEGNCKAINANIRKEKSIKINDLSFCPKKPEKRKTS